MSEITPASSQNSAADSAVTSQRTTATGVDLAPVIISPSKNLWRIEFIFYSCMLVAASIAIFPFFFSAFYWPILWLVFSALIFIALRTRWRAQKLPAVTFSVEKHVWRLRDTTGEFTVVPYGEILLWSWVIILHLRNPVDGKKYHVVALTDSMKEEDWRRLRVWLRTGLRKNL